MFLQTAIMSNCKLSFQWDIKNFDDCDLDFDEFFESPRFSTSDPAFMSDWKLRLYPAGLTVLTEADDGTQKEEKQENLSLLLRKLDSGPDFHIRFSISILNRNLSRILTTNFGLKAMNRNSFILLRKSKKQPIRYKSRITRNGSWMMARFPFCVKFRCTKNMMTLSWSR